MEGVANGLLVPKKPGKSPGKIISMGYRPQGCTISMNDDLLAFFHSVNDGIICPAANGNRNNSIISMGWPYNGYRETVFAELIIQ
jgi:hypothetical protein